MGRTLLKKSILEGNTKQGESINYTGKFISSKLFNSNYNCHDRREMNLTFFKLFIIFKIKTVDTMKKINFSQGRLAVTFILLFALLSVTNSCKKSSDTPGANEVYIENMAFTPHTITVNVNSTVTWTNKDGVAHTVTSSTDLFDSGSIADKGTYSYTFVSAGTFTYNCSIHPSMVGTVIVNPTQPGTGGY